MAGAGRAFLAGPVVAWLLIAVWGVGLAASRLQGIGQLQARGWGRTLEPKIGLAIFAVFLTAVHSVAGSRTSSAHWVAASRVLSPLILVITVAVFYLAVRLTEG